MKRLFSISIAVIMLFASTAQINPVNADSSDQTVLINEVMSANTSTLRDGDTDDAKYGNEGGAYSDWIELYNPGEQPVDLTGYKLSDDEGTWTFPNGMVPAKGYFLVWASGKKKIAGNGQLHTHFKISSSGETITLKLPGGTVADKAKVPALRDNQSYGRKIDGSQDMVIFSISTPCSANISTSTTTAVKMPAFSRQGGFYENGFDLIISTDEPGVRIYYTLDGSDPVPGNASTVEYIDGIKIKSRAGDPNVFSNINVAPPDANYEWVNPDVEIFKCSTVKASAVREDGIKSKTATHTYFVDPDIKTRYSLPVISLVTDKANLFDDETGIYTSANCENKGKEWERPVHMEFFEPGGSLGFSQYIGLRINGGYTRTFAQKSLRLCADSEYDDTGKFKYDVFPGLTKKGTGKKLDSFDSLVLRNAGNDNSSLMFRDELLQSLVSHLKIDTQAYRPSIVFLNGEYWGIYNIRERYDADYFKSHYGVDKDKVALLDVWEYPEVLEGTKEDSEAYRYEIIKYLKENSITQNDTYEYIKTKMDIENYIDYYVAEIITGNNDWPGNNMSIWKYKTDDGKYHPEAPYGQDGRWRWVLRDTDFGYGIWGKSPAHDTLSFAMGDLIEPGAEYANEPWVVFLLNTLLERDDFRNEFINRFADQLNTSFEPKRVTQKIDGAKAAIESAIPEHCDRWPTSDIRKDNWYENIDYMKYFAYIRPDYVREHIINKFSDYGVSGTASIKLDSDSSKGYVKINSIDIIASTPGVKYPDGWTGTYFKGVPVTLKAVPSEGYRFSNWEGVNVTDKSSDTITFTPTGDMNVKAVFVTDTYGYTLSGYISADINGKPGSTAQSKEGFTVEISDNPYTAKTDANGYFRIDDITPSTYSSIKIKKPGFLQREIKDVTISKNLDIGTPDKPILLWPGDMEVNKTQDNAINLIDIIEMAKHFNSVKGNPGYSPQCDFNNDSVVNMLDILIAARSFNRTSADYPAYTFNAN